jgi:transcriptional regulator with XRE-family HTH domain
MGNPMTPNPKTIYARASAGIAFTGFSMLIGTGGDEANFYPKNLPTQFSRPFMVQAHEVVSQYVNNPLEFLNHVETNLTPSISDLAKMLGVSRQAIYKWKNGETMRPDSEQKLKQLALATDIFVQAKVQVTPFMLRRFVHSGQSFLEIVQNGGSAIETAKTLVELVQLGNQQRAAIEEQLASKKVRRTDSIIHDFPVSYEDD